MSHETRGLEPPVIAYSATVLKVEPYARKNIQGVYVAKKVYVENVVFYIRELHPNWDGDFDPGQVEPIIYNYRLHLDKNDKIVGGDWLSSGPDYLSVKSKTPV